MAVRDPEDYDISKLDEEEKLKRYQNRVQWAISDQQDFRDKAEIYLTYYRNKNRVFTRGGQKVIVPRAIKNVDAMHAALTTFDVWPVVIPRGLTTLDMAAVQQEALRIEWEEQEVLEMAEYAIKDGLITGIGYVKVGYEYAEEELDEDAKDDEFGEALADGLSPDDAFNASTQPTVVKDNVTVEHVPYDEVYFDPEAKKWDDIRWIVQKFEMPLQEVMEDESFPAERKKDLGKDAVIQDSWRGERAGHEPDPDEERVILYLFHDLDAGMNYWFSLNHDQILRVDPNPLGLRRRNKDRNPFVPFVTRKDVNKVVGISDIQAMKPSIDEENILRSGLATFVDRNKPKIIADEGVITEQGKRALRSQEWGEVVEVRAGTMSAGGGLDNMQMPTMPQEAFMQDAKAAADSDSSIGLNELLQGNLPSGRKTATAMQQLANAGTVRQAEKRNALNRFYRNIADRMLYLMKLLYEQDRIVRMVEDYGDVVWEFNADDIAFETGIGVELEQKEVLDTEGRREKFGMLLNVLGASPVVDPVELHKWVLKQGFGVPAEVIRSLLKTQEQMQAEQQAALQSQAAGAQAEDGVMPDPAAIPGPLGAEELALAANEGEIPPGME